jgi:hypothetical protein
MTWGAAIPSSMVCAASDLDLRVRRIAIVFPDLRHSMTFMPSICGVAPQRKRRTLKNKGHNRTGAAPAAASPAGDVFRSDFWSGLQFLILISRARGHYG